MHKAVSGCLLLNNDHVLTVKSFIGTIEIDEGLLSRNPRIEVSLFILQGLGSIDLDQRHGVEL
jgi:hypothetical protein